MSKAKLWPQIKSTNRIGTMEGQVRGERLECIFSRVPRGKNEGRPRNVRLEARWG